LTYRKEIVKFENHTALQYTPAEEAEVASAFGAFMPGGS
jgi:hypothetical protein